MNKYPLPPDIKLVDLVNTIKSAISTILELSHIDAANNKEESQYEIRAGLSVSPIVSIQYETDLSNTDPENTDSLPNKFVSIEIDDEQIDPKLLESFLLEIGIDSNSQFNEQRHIIMKRGMLNAFQKSLEESALIKKRKCQKCGFLHPIYRGNRKTCPVCKTAVGASSIIWPYKAVELDSDRGAEETGAPPPTDGGGMDGGGGTMGESAENSKKYAVVLVNPVDKIVLTYYTGEIGVKPLDPTAWSVNSNDASKLSLDDAVDAEEALESQLDAIADSEGWDEEDIELRIVKV
jgi:predicted Zn-ribbon and HTH transcriptional regulator